MLHAPVVPAETRAKHATSLAKSVGWEERNIRTDAFILKTYGSPAQIQTDVLTIYFEGDGLAWIADDRPSDNPTPLTPTALLMAMRDSTNNPVVYLARPCQYVFDQAGQDCRSDYWTHLRFSPEVIRSMNQAVNHVKKYYHAKKIKLIGYSGGSTIAALIAARRNDVMQLITVAGMLDMQHWIKHKSLTPLKGSLDPANEWQKLTTIPQIHWVGEQDTVVPKEVVLAFANRFPYAKKPDVIIIPKFDHYCCWVKEWKVLISSSTDLVIARSDAMMGPG